MSRSLSLIPLINQMVPEQFQREFNIMFKAATEAGLLCRQLRERLDELSIMEKSDHSPVTCN